ncbi:MAG TPA: hypothetical protein VFR47_02950 [Anaerolineales bacterium]|nr:hypothetical protein [Anaerolineales bacterium]
MTLTRNQKTVLIISTLLIWTLACRAATRLIIPDTPTPVPPTSTLTAIPTLPPTLTLSPTPTALVYEASCPLVPSKILEESISTDRFIHGNEAVSEEEITYVVHYTVVGDQLKTPLFFEVGDALEDEQEDRVTHEAIWTLFTHLIPAKQREVLNGFAIFTDGKENYLAAVNQADRNPYKWELNVDIADSTVKTELAYTLLHEYGHLLTLTGEQVEVSVNLYHHPNDSDMYQQEVEACPQYFTGEGCSNPGSYINEFFNRFWTDFYAEWLEIDEEENERTRENMLDNFYDIYQDQFLTDYAPTSPAEDIAESFTFFILSPKPELSSIASEKILFFYEYPELQELRMQILKNICAEFQE